MRVFIDANVIITAARNKGQAGQAALAFLARTDLQFVTSPFIELEVKPTAVREGHHQDVAFIDGFLGKCDSVTDLNRVMGLAYSEMTRLNLKSLDALHLAAVHIGRADRFVTLEKPNKPMFKTTLVTVDQLTI